MGCSNAALNDESAVVSDGSAPKTDSDIQTETDEECRSLLNSRRFAEGEKVLAFHKNQLYEAKVIKVEYFTKKWRYFVHYLGWKKSWDEWLREDSLLKYNEVNVQKQQDLNQNQENENEKAALQLSSTSYGVPRGRKRKNVFLDTEKYHASLDKSMNLQFPPTLKKQLFDDYEFITHLGKLVKLPRTPNVDEILKKYGDYRLQKYGLMPESVEEIVKGLRCCFDKALRVMLLYKNERQQFDNAIRDNASPSTVYGAEHLLRMFVKMPDLIVNASIDEETCRELEEHLVDFLKFLQKNQSEFFLSTYHVLEDTETSSNGQNN